MIALPVAQPLLQTLSLECPFAWRSESYTLTKNIFPEAFDLTISFTATRNSKILGYIPIVGSIIGISRIYKGKQEHDLFKEPSHPFCNRSIKWMTRGVLECIPILGGIVCMIIDVIATVLSRKNSSLIYI